GLAGLVQAALVLRGVDVGVRCNRTDELADVGVAAGDLDAERRLGSTLDAVERAGIADALDRAVGGLEREAARDPVVVVRTGAGIVATRRPGPDQDGKPD